MKVSVPDFNRAVLACRRPNGFAVGESCQLVIRTSEVKLSSRPFEQTENVLQGVMTSRDYRGGLTDHRVQIGSREIVVTSHKLCPMISVEGDGNRVFLYVDKGAISVIANHAAVSSQAAAH
jgi:ABC-type Fe3+/spermidine/putrescine transport system ATPase subunit